MASTPEQDAHEGAHGAFHLPPPSIWPATVALGVALVLVGLILNLIIVVVGAIILVASIALWVRDARREFTELPE